MNLWEAKTNADKASKIKWTEEQEAIFEAVRNLPRGGALGIEARAGTGKTTTAEHSFPFTKRAGERGKAAFLAFNKKNGDELDRRTPANVTGCTFHALAMRIVKPDEGVNLGKKWTIVKVQIEQYKLRAPAVQLAGLAQNLAFGLAGHVASVEEFERLIGEYGIRHQKRFRPVDVARAGKRLFEACVQDFKSSGYDFDDLLYAVARDGVGRGFEPLDWLYVDECFTGDAPVLLADGTTMPIGEIVNNERQVDVLSWDEVSGRQVVKTVRGGKKTLRKGKMVRLRVQRVGYGASGRLGSLTEKVRYGTRVLVCTEDHPVYVNGRGWVAAGDVCPGERLHLESEAPKATAYQSRWKIGRAGREKLGALVVDRLMSEPTRRSPGPPSQGGNGRGSTIPQQRLHDALGDAWQSEYVIPTGKDRPEGAPKCYKIDLAHVGCRIAVEVDGASHNGTARREQDARKDAFLRSLGWTVLRVTNQQAFNNAEEIAAKMPTACPVEAEVLDVEQDYPVEDYYLYDLNVEDTHTYYVNGILVHNCQDTNPVQLLMIDRIRSAGDGGCRLVFLGDPRQAIYGWRGAGTHGFLDMVDRYGARVLPLTITQRCPRSVVESAQEIVPDIRPRADAPEGSVQNLWAGEFSVLDIPNASSILCRNNAPLLTLALDAIMNDRPIHMAGKDLQKKIVTTLDAHVRDDFGRASPHRLLADALGRLREELKDRPMTYDLVKDEITAAGAMLSIVFRGNVQGWEAFANYEALLIAVEKACAKLFFDPEKGQPDGIILSTIHRCVAPETLVEQRGLREIADIPKRGKIGTVEGALFYEGKVAYPRRKMVRLRTKRGYEVGVTLDHGMMAWDGQGFSPTLAGNLVAGQFLRLVRGTSYPTLDAVEMHGFAPVDVRAKEHTSPETLTGDLAEFLGLMVADGTVHDGGFRLVKRHLDVVERFADLARSLFEANPRVRARKGEKAFEGEVHSTQLVGWLREIRGLNPRDKSVPECVLRSPPLVQAAFLRGLFEDGTVCVQGGTVDHVSFSTAYEDMAKTVQILLLGLNIPCTRKLYRTCWRLSISGDALDIFKASVGFVASEKNQKLDLPRRPSKNGRVPVSWDSPPAGADAFLAQNARFRGYVSEATARAWGVGEPDRFLYDEIESIEPYDGPAVCVSVPGHGRFVQNGFDGCNSKGLEWDDVYFFAPELIPSKAARKLGGWHLEQECNLDYVARTRAKKNLTFVRSRETEAAWDDGLETDGKGNWHPGNTDRNGALQDDEP